MKTTSPADQREFLRESRLLLIELPKSISSGKGFENRKCVLARREDCVLPGKGTSLPVCEQFPYTYPQGDVKRPIIVYVPIVVFKYRIQTGK